MAKYTEHDLEILVATMERSDLAFLETMFQMPLEDITASILIVNQTKSQQLISNQTNIKVINDEGTGLSRSRNLAIDQSTKNLLWIIDDDCEVMPNSIEEVISAHNRYSDSILVFETLRKEELKPFYTYPNYSKILDKKELKNVLSPEITLKRKSIIKSGLRFDERFGLGAKFQDSENFIFLLDALKLNLKTRFFPAAIVKHRSTTSSDAASSDRIIYARGALAARQGRSIATLLNFKYSFFLIRKGFVKSLTELKSKHSVFREGIIDYLSCKD